MIKNETIKDIILVILIILVGIIIGLGFYFSK